MKSINQYIQEKLILTKDIINKNVIKYNYFPKNRDELNTILDEKIKNVTGDYLDLKDINVTELKYFNELFKNYLEYNDKIKIIDITGWNPNTIMDIDGMFKDCAYVKEIIGFDSIKNLHGNLFDLFGGCESLVKIYNIENINISKVSSISYMFDMCASLENLNLSNWDTSNIKFTTGTFRGCTKLKNINLSNWKFKYLNHITSMFKYCESLENIGDISNWDVSNVADMKETFYGCEKLQYIGDISKWNISNCRNLEQMFYNCKNLKLDISSWGDKFNKKVKKAYIAKGVNTKIFIKPKKS